MVGSSLLHFNILRKIGSGAMSVVYEALDTKLERRVALKLLLVNLDVDQVAHARFLLEAKIISRFDHPNVGVIYSMEEVAGQTFLVMALYEGETLESRLSNSQLTIPTIIQFALHIAAALEHAHALGVIHRDIKPANIFIAKDSSGTEKIKVLDFGLAKLDGKSVYLSKTNHMVGTILYAAPEQLKGKTSPQSDIWAWGCVVYEMLTQTAPFQAANINDVIHKTLNNEPKPLEQFRDDIPDGLVHAVMKSLEKNPQQRIQSAQELIALLEQCQLETKSIASGVTLHGSSTALVSFPKAKLPSPNTEFIGRETELEQLLQLLQPPMSQLVTVIGLGGMGKTRLVLEVARQAQDTYRDGAVFVDLTQIEDAQFLPNAILNALEVKANKDPLQDMYNALLFREILLVLDNFEHLMAAKNIVSQILLTAPKIQLLITSRESLGLHAEVTFELGGFPEPNDIPLDIQNSAQIFLNSAKRVNREFMFEPSDHLSFKRIFRALSGSPLGLSLAGTWTQILGVSEIADELEANINMLETNAPDIPLRQRSFVAVFYSSWQYLSPLQQVMLAKLTLFQNGFGKDWAKQVAGANLNDLQNLIQKSLISRKNNRYSIHELVRQFAEKELSALDRSQAMDALAGCCLKLCRENHQAEYGEGHLAWINLLKTEYENIRSVLSWSVLQQVNPDIGIELLTYLKPFWRYQGLQREGIYWSKQFLSTEVSTKNQSILQTIIPLAISVSDYQLAQEKLVTFELINEHFDDLFGMGQYYAFYGQIEAARGEDVIAKNYFEEAISIFRETEQLLPLARTYGYIGLIHMKHEPNLAQSYFEHALKIYVQLGHLRGQAASLQDLSLVARAKEDYQKEAILAHEGLLLTKQIGDPLLLADGLTNLAGRLEQQNDFVRAQFYLIQALKIFFQANLYRFVADILWFIAKARFELRDYESGIVLRAAAQATFLKIGTKHRPDDWQENPSELYQPSGLSLEKALQLEHQGTIMNLGEAVNYAAQTFVQEGVQFESTDPYLQTAY